MAFGLPSLTSIFSQERAGPSRGEVFIGVDIGSSAIKVIQLKNVRGVPTLDTYGELQLGPYEGIDIGRSTQLPVPRLVEALVDILREAGATGKRVAFTLSYNASFINVITIPTRDEQKISAMLPVEARKYVPLALSRVTLDWVALSANEETHETKILLSAVYNEAVSRYESIMGGAALEVEASEIELFSSIRSAIDPKDGAVAVLDVGASSTRLYIVEKGFVQETHSVLMSGSDMTSAIARDLGVSFSQAEEMKRLYGLIPSEGADPRIEKALTRAMSRGLRELHMVMTQYEKDHAVLLEKVIVSGGGSLLIGLDAYLKEALQHPITFADPFSKVAYPAFLEDTLKQAGPSFAVSVGISLRAFEGGRKG